MKGPEDSAPVKVGAGLLICCEGSCLLLRRSDTSGNPGTWGLPGGNADAADAGDLVDTAMREAREEVGEVPEGLQVLGSVLTRRGKALQKHYTVFVAAIPGNSRNSYAPKLNDEHTDWRWLDISHAAALAGGQHPLLHASAAGAPQADVAAELAAGAVAAAGPPPPDMALHPVVRILFGGAHTVALAGMLPPSVGSPIKQLLPTVQEQ